MRKPDQEERFVEQRVTYTLEVGGRFVVIDYQAANSPHRDQPNLIVSEEQVTGWMKAAGFGKVEKVDLFPDKYFLIFSR